MISRRYSRIITLEISLFSLTNFYLSRMFETEVERSRRDTFSLEVVWEPFRPLKFLGCSCLPWGEMLRLILSNLPIDLDKEEVLKTVFKRPLMSLDFYSFLLKVDSPSKQC